MLKTIAKYVLKFQGWSVKLEYPKEAHRCVMIAAPHTSNWDGYFVRVALWVLGIPVRIAIKDNWTKGPIGIISKGIGFLGIDRSKKDPNKPRKSQTQQMADFFKTYDEIALVIAPEGSRALRKQWKLGFYHVAKMANVPITFGYLDYEKKEAGVGGVIFPTDDLESDLKTIMEFYKNIVPENPDNYSLDERYV